MAGLADAYLKMTYEGVVGLVGEISDSEVVRLQNDRAPGWQEHRAAVLAVWELAPVIKFVQPLVPLLRERLEELGRK